MQKVERAELVLIYRKVKQHVFEQTSCPRLFKIIRFEESFAENLNCLLKSLNDEFSVEEDTLDLVSKCEGVCVIPHRIENGKTRVEDYKCLAAGCNQKVNSLGTNTVYIQTLADIPIVCEMVFALWMSRVGHFVDESIGKQVWGNRLERQSDGLFPIETPALYRYYLSDKRKWHEEIASKADTLLSDGHNLLLIATELKNRYIFSSWKPLIDESDLGLELLKGNVDVMKIVDQNKWLTNLVVKMLMHWRESSGLGMEGIPMGSVIAGLMMNVRLMRFDEQICKAETLNVLYYSRCERMFVLIVDDKKELDDKIVFDLVHDCAISCFTPKSMSEKTKPNPVGSNELQPTSDDNVFHRSRSRVLRLHAEAGRNLLAVFKHALDEDRGSWQNMPEAPDVGYYVRNMYSLFGRVEDEPGLLNLNQPMLSRRRFTKQIQDMEQYLAFLNQEDWAKQRISFLTAVKDMLADVSAFALYYSLFPRLLAIAFATALNVKSPEFIIANQIIKAICAYLDIIPRRMFPLNNDREKRSRLDRVLKKRVR